MGGQRVVEQLTAPHPGVQQTQWQFEGVGPGDRISLAGKQFGAGDEDLPFLVQRRHRQARGVDAVWVDDSSVEFEAADAFDDARRAQAALQLHSYQRVFEAERIGQQRYGAGSRGDDAEPQLAGQAGLQRGHLVDERVVIGQNPAGPQHQPFAFGRQTFVVLPAPHQRNLELVLELADRFGQCRLRHVAGRSRPREVLLAGERHEIFELAEEHGLFDHV